MKRILCIWLPDWPIQRLIAARPELDGRPMVLDRTCRGSRRVAACSAAARAVGIVEGMPLSEATALAREQPVREKGDSPHLPERPEGCFAQMGTIPFFPPRQTGWGLHAEPYDATADREALEELTEACQKFSPLVGLEDAPAPSCLLLEITGLEHLFGGEAMLAERVFREFTARGLDAKLAVADTIGAAWAVAHYAESGGSSERKKCQLACSETDDLALGKYSSSSLFRASSPKLGVGARSGSLPAQYDERPNGTEKRNHTLPALRAQTEERSFPAALPLIPDPSPARGEGRREIDPARGEGRIETGREEIAICLVAPGQTLAALRPLPIEALRLPEETAALLRQLGVYRIGQLERLPREDLNARFGPQLLRRWDQATGALAEPVPACPLPQRFQAELSLEYPTAKRETIEFVLEQLMGRLTQMLARAGQGALQLECRLDCRPAKDVNFDIGLFRPSAAAAHLIGLMRTRLERLRISSPVNAVHLEVTRAAVIEIHQDELFSTASCQPHPRHWAALIDRLASRLGRSAVVRVRLVPDAQPEFACRYEPLVQEPSGRLRLGATGILPVKNRGGTGKMRMALGKEMPLAPRPLRLWTRPVPLAAFAIAPSGPPLRFHWQGEEQEIAITWGPERIETGWWRGRVVGRDYYRVETTTGRRYWLFRRLRDGRWFLHGAFE